MGWPPTPRAEWKRPDGIIKQRDFQASEASQKLAAEGSRSLKDYSSSFFFFFFLPFILKVVRTFGKP